MYMKLKRKYVPVGEIKKRTMQKKDYNGLTLDIFDGSLTTVVFVGVSL